jgi:hypothetical protein
VVLTSCWCRQALQSPAGGRAPPADSLTNPGPAVTGA